MDNMPDWLLLSIRDKGPREHYRWNVELVNVSRGEPGERMSWAVPDLNDHRFGVHVDAAQGTAEALTAARVPA